MSVLHFDTEARGQPFHFAPLIAREPRGFSAHAASREIGDDSVAHSGRRIVHLADLEALENSQQRRDSGHDDLGAARTDTRNLTAARQVTRYQIAIQFADLGSG